MTKSLYILLTIFFILQFPLFFSLATTDEHIYYEMAHLTSEGAKPHTDFFLSHPNTQIGLYVLIIRLFGLHTWILKLTTYLFQIGSAIFIFLIAKERYNEKTGLIATFLFLSCYDVFCFGSFSIGLEISLFFFLASLYYNNKESLLSGILFAFCILTRLHFAILGLILLFNSKERRKFLTGCSIAIIPYTVWLRIPNFVEQVFSYHAIKPVLNKGWRDFIVHNTHLLIFFCYAIKKIKDNLLIAIGILYLLFISFIKSGFEYYFILPVAILCIEGAQSLTSKKLLWFILIVFITLFTMKAIYFSVSQSSDYYKMIDYVDSLENNYINGDSPLAAMIAFKTNKTVPNMILDKNFQRNLRYDFNNSIVIYRQGSHPKYLNKTNCSIIKIFMVHDWAYEIFDCKNKIKPTL